MVKLTGESYSVFPKTLTTYCFVLPLRRIENVVQQKIPVAGERQKLFCHNADDLVLHTLFKLVLHFENTKNKPLTHQQRGQVILVVCLQLDFTYFQ